MYTAFSERREMVVSPWKHNKTKHQGHRLTTLTSLMYSIVLSCVGQAALQWAGLLRLVMEVDSRLSQLVMFMNVFIENVNVRCGNLSRLFANTRGSPPLQEKNYKRLLWRLSYTLREKKKTILFFSATRKYLNWTVRQVWRMATITPGVFIWYEKARPLHWRRDRQHATCCTGFKFTIVRLHGDDGPRPLKVEVKEIEKENRCKRQGI